MEPPSRSCAPSTFSIFPCVSVASSSLSPSAEPALESLLRRLRSVSRRSFFNVAPARSSSRSLNSTDSSSIWGRGGASAVGEVVV